MKQLTALSMAFCMTLLTINCLAQSVSGTFSMLPNKAIKLEGFNGLKTYQIDAGQTDDKGNFKLKYAASDFGMGYLMSADNKAFFVILCGEDVEISGEAPAITESIKVLKGQQNRWFGQYASEHPRREQALSAWAYLEKIYVKDSLFSVQKVPTDAIKTEKGRIKTEDDAYTNSLPADSYVRWFLPTRRLVSSVSAIAQYRTEEMPATIRAFRDLDYTDPRLYKSGLFKDAIESHFWLLENSGRPLDSVFAEMKISIDVMMGHLIKDPKKLNEVTDFLFDLLERHSLFQASEHLALKVLNDVSCTVDNNLSKQLETYRAMKKGNTAPDFNFPAGSVFPAHLAASKPKKLSDIPSKYVLMLFGSSTCPKCKEEIPEVAKLYEKWRAQGMEVVYISLDDKEEDHKKFQETLPFTGGCDYGKWKSPIVEAYYVFGTPTMFLLDNTRKILLRPNSVKQVDAWVDWYLAQGNK